MTPRSRRRAAALVVTLALLAAIAVVAAGLARLAGAERDAARSVRDEARARLAAEAGIEYARARLLSRLAADGRLGTETLDSPWELAVGERARFEVRAVDASGKLWIGGLAPESVPGWTAVDEADRRRRVGRILDHLCRALGLPGDLGARLMARQPASGWQDDDALRAALEPAAYEALAPHATCRAGWIDAGLVRGDERGELRRFVGSPINVNTASAPVLAAILEGVSGVTRRPVAAGRRSYRIETAETRPLGAAEAARLAGRLVAARAVAPLGDRVDVHQFLQAAVESGIVDAGQASALHANLDPHPVSDWLNPDATLARPVAKADVLDPTIEFAFDAGGVFELESTGRCTSPEGELLASATVRAVVRLFETVRVAPQRDLEGLLLEGAGMAAAPIAPGGGFEPLRALEGRLAAVAGRAPRTAGRLVFEAPGRGSLAPAVAAVRASGDRGWLGTATEAAGEDGAWANLQPDGVLFDHTRLDTWIHPTQNEDGTAFNLPLAEGRLDFFFKLDPWSTVLETVPLLLATNPDSPNSGLQTKVFLEGGRVVAERYWFSRLRDALTGPSYDEIDADEIVNGGALRLREPSRGGAPAGDATALPRVEFFSYRAEIPLERRAHEWVHVALAWRDLVEFDLAAGGRTVRATPGPGPARDPMESVLPHNWPDLYLGPVYFDRDGRWRDPELAGPTAADEVQLSVWTLTDLPRYTLAGLSIRDRYGDPATTELAGRYALPGPVRAEEPVQALLSLPLPARARVLSVAWSEVEPETSFLDVYYLSEQGFAPLERGDGAGSPVPFAACHPAGEPRALTLLVAVTDVGSRPIQATSALQDLVVRYRTGGETFLEWRALGRGEGAPAGDVPARAGDSGVVYGPPGRPLPARPARPVLGSLGDGPLLRILRRSGREVTFTFGGHDFTQPILDLPGPAGDPVKPAGTFAVR